MAADSNKTLIKHLVRGDAAAFHKACRDFEEDALSLNGATFKNLQLVGFDLSKFDLSATEWENCTLTAMKWNESNLQGAYFNGCALIECDFGASDMDGCALDGSVIQNTTLFEANLDNTEIENTQFQDCVLGGKAMSDIAWSRVSLKGGQFKEIPEASGEVVGMDLREVTLTQVDLSGLAAAKSFHYGCTMEDAALPEQGFALKSGRRRSV